MFSVADSAYSFTYKHSVAYDQNNIRCCVIILYWNEIYEGKGKGYPITGHEGPEGEWKYSCALFLTSSLQWMDGQRHTPAALTLERHGTHCTGGTGIRSQDRPARSESLYRLSYPGP